MKIRYIHPMKNLMKSPVYFFRLIISVTIFSISMTFALQGKASETGPTRISTIDPQKMQLLNSGIGALQKRFEMIESAKKSIDVEYFIYNIDKVGRLFTQSLIKKAQKDNIKVRLLVDSSVAVFQLTGEYTSAIQSAVKAGLIEIKYYNKNAKIDVVGMQFRSHRKSLIIDGDATDGQAITGGRNIAEEYFDLSGTYNFLDTDLYIQGTLVRSIKKSFDDFWNSGLTVAAPKTASGNSGDLLKAKDFIVQNAQDIELLKKISVMGGQILKTQVSSVCTDSEFVADGTDKSPNSPVYNLATSEILKAREYVEIESPYFVVSYDGFEFLKSVIEVGSRDSKSGKEVELRLLTNSLNSTDATYTSATLYPFMALWRNIGIDLHLYRGESPLYYSIPYEAPYHARWGTHSKRAVIDGTTILVGTYNADPRSKDLNAEMALVCRHNGQLGQALHDNFQGRLTQSTGINRFGLPEDGRFFSGVDLLKGLQFGLFLVPANLVDFLL